MIVIFDLDHTVIDSSHRQLTRADGSLDLGHWRENCIPHKIMADTLLPLAKVMRRYFSEGHTIVVCTARVCGEADMQFLYTHGLQYHHFISRDADDMRGDAQYKSEKLAHWANCLNLPRNWRSNAMMFDDNLAVIRQMLSERLMCFNAIKYNRRLALAEAA